jgi:membrane-associated phospholipid phosphatase
MKPLHIFPTLFIALLLLGACNKKDVAVDKNQEYGKQTKTYSSEVLQEWIKFDLQLLRANASKLNNFVMMHHWAYSSIALYEAISPGMPAYQTLASQLNEMPAMPKAEKGKTYHWPTTANAVLADMTRSFYLDSISQKSKDSIAIVEDAFNAHYKTEVDAATFERSKAFGHAVAAQVLQWALTDGYLTKHPTYTLPVGPGQWERTPPDFLAPQRPFWGTNRPLMKGSIDASRIPPPPAFSTDPSSAFYTAANEVYGLSKTLTDDQKAQVLFWRDVPGGGHAHWLSIFLNVLSKEGNSVTLDKAALVYAKLGISQSDARISCWKAKYQFNLVRPVTYINALIDKTKQWKAFIATPNHPEYPSAHSSFSAPAAAVLTAEFGESYTFTDDTYNFLQLPARNYLSFYHAAVEAGESRVYGGLHYRFSIEAGAQLGAAIAKYMYDNIRFKKR